MTTNIRGWIWMKMISSLCWNPVATLGHATLGAVHEHPDAVDLVRRMMIEAENVAAALGVTLPVGREKRIATTRLAGGHKMSMLQDLERGRPLEIDALADSITDDAADCRRRNPNDRSGADAASVRAEASRREQRLTEIGGRKQGCRQTKSP